MVAGNLLASKHGGAVTVGIVEVVGTSVTARSEGKLTHGTLLLSSHIVPSLQLLTFPNSKLRFPKLKHS